MQVYLSFGLINVGSVLDSKVLYKFMNFIVGQFDFLE